MKQQRTKKTTLLVIVGVNSLTLKLKTNSEGKDCCVYGLHGRLYFWQPIAILLNFVKLRPYFLVRINPVPTIHRCLCDAEVHDIFSCLFALALRCSWRSQRNAMEPSHPTEPVSSYGVCLPLLLDRAQSIEKA